MSDLIDKNEPIATHNLERIQNYARHALSENTWKSYEYDLEHFQDWGGTIPTSPEIVASYLVSFAHTLAISTLTRRLAAINKAHEMRRHPSPTKTQIVRLTMKGIKRKHSVQQKQASPLLRDDIIAINNRIPDSVKGIRDRALMMIGFAGALRRSELVNLNQSDIEQVQEGIVITLNQSKTDQEGHGRKIAIPRGRTRHCPVQALQNWLDELTDDNTPLFRPVHKYGYIRPSRLSDSAVSCLVKEYAELIGLDRDEYSGHSLRAGFITSCAQMGIPEWQIMKQSGHKSHQSMMRYIRDARLFEEHPLDNMF